MADWTDQWFGWQDIMTENWEASMLLDQDSPGIAHVLWPGESKPGLFMSFVYKLGQLILNSDVEGIVLPPIFNKLKGPFSQEDEVESLKIYNDVVLNKILPQFSNEAITLLNQAIKHNPYFPESHIYLSQLYLQNKDWQLATDHAIAGLKLLQEWGISSDKRVSWETWIAWGRVLYQNSIEQTWPSVALKGGRQSIIGLGLVY